jgi:nucleoside-diphosphate-sugar epimerase
MRILVLGGTHFIGPAAVGRLVGMGHEVAVFHRGQTNADLPGNVQHLYGDRTRLTDFVTDFRQFAPEVVLDMNAYTEEDGTTLVALFSGMARRLVAISSGDVYRAYDRFRKADPGPPDPTPLTEDAPLRDRLYPYRQNAKGPEDFAYAYEKILMERAVQSSPKTLPATVLRLPMVYGPGDYQLRLFPYIKRMDDGRPAILLSESQASWRALRGYVEDLGEAIALCVASERAAGRTYHVADKDNLTELEWVERIARAAEWHGKIIVVPDDRLPEHLKHDYDYAQDWSLDSSRLREELGYCEPTAPETAMQRSVRWQRANPHKDFAPDYFDYVAEDAAMTAQF